MKFDNDIKLENRGEIVAHGTKYDSIFFTSNSINPNYQSWSGIYLTGLSTFNLKYCKGSFANSFIHIQHSGNCDIKNSRFTNCNVVFYCSGGSQTIDSSMFENNITAIDGGWNMSFTNCIFKNNVDGIINIPDPHIYNCIFSGNSGIGIHGNYGEIRFCEITNNNIGLSYSMSGGFDAATIKNNIIAYNDIGFRITGNNPLAEVSNNAFCYNITYDVENTSTYSPDLSNNCWCSTDSSSIANKIFDAYDDITVGIVNFSPFINDTNCIEYIIPSSISIPKKTNIALQIYPNPFTESTVIEFDNINNSPYSLTIIDLQGKPVKKINNVIKDRIILNRENLKSGIYFIQINSTNQRIGIGKLLIK